MYDLSCKLLTRTIVSDSIGVENEIITELEVPIIKIEDVYSSEFYEANEQGFRPELRLKISNLNYSGQTELIYMGTTYIIIRTEEPYADETILICERKAKNV